MTALAIPMMTRTTHPLLTGFMLLAVGTAIVYVVYLMAQHERRVRRAHKQGTNLRHDGRHGNH